MTTCTPWSVTAYIPFRATAQLVLQPIPNVGNIIPSETPTSKFLEHIRCFPRHCCGLVVSTTKQTHTNRGTKKVTNPWCSSCLFLTFCFYPFYRFSHLLPEALLLECVDVPGVGIGSVGVRDGRVCHPTDEGTHQTPAINEDASLHVVKQTPP